MTSRAALFPPDFQRTLLHFRRPRGILMRMEAFSKRNPRERTSENHLNNAKNKG